MSEAGGTELVKSRPWRFYICDRSGRRLTALKGIASQRKVTVRRNLPGSFSFEADAANPRLTYRQADGFPTLAKQLRTIKGFRFEKRPDISTAAPTLGTSATAVGHVPSLTVNKPTGTADGETLVALISTPGAATVTAPDGWERAGQHFTSVGNLEIWTHLCGSSEPSTYTWTILNPVNAIKWMVGVTRLIGARDEHPISHIGFAGTQTGLELDQALTPGANEMILCALTTTTAGVTLTESGSSGATSQYGLVGEAGYLRLGAKASTGDRVTVKGQASTAVEMTGVIFSVTGPTTPQDDAWVQRGGWIIWQTQVNGDAEGNATVKVTCYDPLVMLDKIPALGTAGETDEFVFDGIDAGVVMQQLLDAAAAESF